MLTCSSSDSNETIANAIKRNKKGKTNMFDDAIECHDNLNGKTSWRRSVGWKRFSGQYSVNNL